MKMRNYNYTLSKKSTSGGLGIFSVVQIVFLILKILNIQPVSDWDWTIVLIPTWISVGLAVIGIICALIYMSLLSQEDIK